MSIALPVFAILGALVALGVMIALKLPRADQDDRRDDGGLSFSPARTPKIYPFAQGYFVSSRAKGRSR